MVKQVTVIRRPPTVVLFFAGATAHNLIAALNEVSEPLQFTSLDPVEWYFPSNSCWRVLVRFDDEIFATYAEQEKELIYAGVGRTPSAILKLTLDWRSLEEARKAAKTLVEHLLGMFYGIADDRSGEESIWNIEEIRNTKHGVEFPEKADMQILHVISDS
jgi:hypothetical protein